MDGADFEVLGDQGVFNGGIEVKSIDSGRNWIQFLTGKRPEINGVVDKFHNLNHGEIEKIDNPDLCFNISNDDINCSMIMEDLQEIGYDVGSYYVPGTSPEIKVNDLIPDTYEATPQPFDNPDELLRGERTLIDVDSKKIVDSVYDLVNTKHDQLESRIEHQDIVFVLYGFPDILKHAHLEKACDDLIEEVVSFYRERFDKIICISDHTITKKKSRQAMAVHGTPAYYCVIPGGGNRSLEPDEVYDFIMEEVE